MFMSKVRGYNNKKVHFHPPRTCPYVLVGNAVCLGGESMPANRSDVDRTEWHPEGCRLHWRLAPRFPFFPSAGIAPSTVKLHEAATREHWRYWAEGKALYKWVWWKTVWRKQFCAIMSTSVFSPIARLAGEHISIHPAWRSDCIWQPLYVTNFQCCLLVVKPTHCQHNQAIPSYIGISRQ